MDKFFNSFMAKSFVGGVLVLILGTVAFYSLDTPSRALQFVTYCGFLGVTLAVIIARSVASDITENQKPQAPIITP
jgi:Na+/melibiose symporter-like transporter